MAINISLVNFTEQGIRNVKDSPKRAQGFRDLAKKHGVSVRDLYWTTGQYDMIAITEGDDEALIEQMGRDAQRARAILASG